MIMARVYILGGFLVFLAGVVTLAYMEGKTRGRVEQLNQTVRAYEKRAKIDAKIDTSSRFDLCVQLGGLRDECAELRGVGQTAPTE